MIASNAADSLTGEPLGETTAATCQCGARIRSGHRVIVYASAQLAVSPSIDIAYCLTGDCRPPTGFGDDDGDGQTLTGTQGHDELLASVRVEPRDRAVKARVLVAAAPELRDASLSDDGQPPAHVDEEVTG